MNWDLLPASVCLAVWILCHLLQVKLMPKEQHSALLMVPWIPMVSRTAWALALLRLNRFLIGLLEQFGQLHPFQWEHIDLAFEPWLCSLIADRNCDTKARAHAHKYM